ncbi:hypothetical protein [Marinomonas sp. UCMA 3892]|uniref:hypothetical protein n=1 Tax=unclassified Marinomonas TaxID=196814 RepID=UPI00146ADEC0|nr:hypothetical protein [Marinomonas sp. UCMA 3892]
MKIRTPSSVFPLKKGEETWQLYSMSYAFTNNNEEQSKHQERGQTTVSSGGVWFAPSADVEVRVKAFPLAL